MTVAQELAATLNKKLGENTIIFATEMRNQVIPRITSGILSLDVALGGGWPMNQWHEIIGEESSGKTATILQTIAANQAADPTWEVLWIAAEEFVPEYAEKIGCDLSRMVVVDTNIMEKAYEVILDFLDARAVDCIVVDSLPALVPSEEGEKTMEDFQVGLGARVTGKFFRKVRKSGQRSLVIEDRPVTCFMINQYRVKVGGWAPHGQEPTTTPGGKAKNYHYFTRCELRRDEWLEEDKERVGQAIKFRFTKNKSAPPQQVAYADFYFADTRDGHHSGEFDRAKDVFNTAILKGIIERKGAWFMFGEEHRWQGRAGAAKALYEDPDIMSQVESKVLEMVRRERGEEQHDG